MKKPDFVQDDISFYCANPSDYKYNPNELKLSDQSLIEQCKSKTRKMEIFCSRKLMYEILPDVDITKNEDGSLNFPGDISGCLTHKDGVIIFAIVKERGAHLGIDLERSIVPIKLKNKIAKFENFENLVKNTSFNKEEILALSFSAKEAIYKAISGEMTSKISFDDVVLEEIVEIKNEVGLVKFYTNHFELNSRHITHFNVKYLKVNSYKGPLILTFIKI